MHVSILKSHLLTGSGIQPSSSKRNISFFSLTEGVEEKRQEYKIENKPNPNPAIQRRSSPNSQSSPDSKAVKNLNSIGSQNFIFAT